MLVTGLTWDGLNFGCCGENERFAELQSVVHGECKGECHYTNCRVVWGQIDSGREEQVFTPLLARLNLDVEEIVRYPDGGERYGGAQGCLGES